MKSRAAGTGALVGLAVLGPFAARPALAAGCALDVDEDRALVARWPGIGEEVRDALAARSDIETCARVKLRSTPRPRVEVVLPDGRVASRAVARRDDVVPTVAALLLVPGPAAEDAVVAGDGAPTDAAAPASPMPELSPPLLTASPSLAERPAGLVRRGASTAAPSRFGFELSALAGARVGDRHRSFGGGLLSFVELSGWLAGFAGRFDQYVRFGGGDRTTTALELGVLGGRRLRWKTFAIDIIAGPAMAMLGSQADYEKTEVGGLGPVYRRESSGAVPRALAGVRLVFGSRSTFRSFVAVDADVGPTRTAPALTTEDPELPRWTLGLAFGGAVGTR